MSVSADPFEVLSSERGVVRVFAADDSVIMVPDAVHAFLGENLTLDASRVEVFEASVLGDMALSEYLKDGYGIPDDALDAARDDLDAVDGVVVLVASAAFQGQSVRLVPNAALKFLGAFEEPGRLPPKRMAGSERATGRLEPKGEVTPSSKTRDPVVWLVALTGLLVAAGLVLFAVF